MPYHVSPNPKSRAVGKVVPDKPATEKADDSKWTKVPDPDASTGRGDSRDATRTAQDDPDIKRADRAPGDIER